MKDLKNLNVSIVQPDKAAGYVVMDTVDYQRKMLSILQDASKFMKSTKPLHLVDIEQTVSNELKILLTHGLLDQTACKAIKSVGKHWP